MQKIVLSEVIMIDSFCYNSDDKNQARFKRFSKRLARPSLNIYHSWHIETSKSDFNDYVNIEKSFFFSDGKKYGSNQFEKSIKSKKPFFFIMDTND